MNFYFEPQARRSPIDELLDMVERRAPILARQWRRENHVQHHVVTPEEKRHIVQLYIARSAGISPDTSESRRIMEVIAVETGVHYQTVARYTREVRHAAARAKRAAA